MAGFLDSQQQIIDMVLTGHGKKLLSHGELRFVYWAAYDDDIIYGQSGSLTEDPLQREATIGYKMFNLRGEDYTNVNKALITVPPGWDVVPSATIQYDNNEINVQQQQVVQNYSNEETNLGTLRSNSTTMKVTAEYTKESYPRSHKMEGFFVRLLAAQTASVNPDVIRYVETHHTLSDDSDIVVGPELKLVLHTPGE